MNGHIHITASEVLSEDTYLLKKVTFDYRKDDGTWESQKREVYERGNAAAVLLYNQDSKTVILTNQFRLPSYLNGNDTGMLLEVCAGMLDDDNPEDCARREIEEETGYKIAEVTKAFEAYMSPGALTESIHFFTARYTGDMKVSEGGGLEEEHEHIEVIEMSFEKALELLQNGSIRDAKTIMLLQYAQIHKLIQL